MSQPNVLERRIVALMASDVAGYSRLMQADEAGTLAALNAVREIIQKQIAQHRGRIANTAGDSVLAEFASAVDAVSCALIIQELLIQDSARCGGLKIRIGIHSGDVVTKSGDIFGTAVNIAARLENIAQPGGIAASAAVRDDVAGKLPASFKSLGSQQLKNIEQPVQVYSVLSQVGGSASSIAEADKRLNLPQSRGISIVVLPFANISKDSEHGFLADGLTEDLITELSRLKDFLVIARNTAFTYKGRAVDIGQVGRDLGVRYVLEGSMRSLGSRVRITAQLIDAKSGTHIWAEKFDRDQSQLIDVQDEVVRAVAASTQIQLMIREGEAADRGTNLDCWTLTMQAMAEIYKFSAESLAKAENIARQLVAGYPLWPKGHMSLAAALYHRMLMGYRPSTAELKDEAVREVREALRLDSKDEIILAFTAMIIMDYLDEAAEAIPLLRRSLEINPNYSLSYGLLGEAYQILGQPDEAIRNAEIAIRLNPRDPGIFFRYNMLAMANFQKQDDDKALHWANQLTALRPDYWHGHAISAAILVSRNELELARKSAAALRRCWPNATIGAMNAFDARNELPWMERYFRGLIAAGVPE